MNDDNLNSPAAFDPNLRYFLQPQPQPVYNEDLSQRGTFFDMHEAVAKSNFLCVTPATAEILLQPPLRRSFFRSFVWVRPAPRRHGGKERRLA
jgi:hypothetical protein